MKNPSVIFLFILIFASYVSVVNSQTETKFSTIESAFEAYTAPYKEIVYTHLNKTILIKGEMLGFSSYVLDKEDKTLSKITKNLYCVITDSSNTIVKSKLLKVENGFANNVFNIDSTYTSGYYTFKTYTNWMRNFNEQNSHVQRFRVIDPEKVTIDKTQRITNKLDIQFLPEGGHFIDDVKTNVGVIAKNELGFGVPHLEGVIHDRNDSVVTRFKTNVMGISRFELKPDIGKGYTAKVDYKNKDFTFGLGVIKPQGISITLNNFRERMMFLRLSTNTATLPSIKQKAYKLTVHNGKSLKVLDVSFRDTEVLMQIESKELFKGINIFTLFDDRNQPILERLVFNYNGMEFAKLGKPSIGKVEDSVHISMMLGQSIKDLEHVNISISALPKNTVSYTGHHSIISQTYLQPYINGLVENASYYFNGFDHKKAFELDNLLITQGWSSYDWHAITNNGIRTNHVFENGIMVQVHNNNPEDSEFLIHATDEQDGFFVNFDDNRKSFIEQGFFPTDSSSLYISALRKNNKLKAPSAYIQYAPSEIPSFTNTYPILNPTSPVITEASLNTYFNNVQLYPRVSKLEEVIINAKTKRERIIDKYSNSAFYGNVDVFDDESQNRYLTLANYLSSKGFIAYEVQGVLTINPRGGPTSFEGGSMDYVFYLDDVRASRERFINFDMNMVDYIAINRHGIGNSIIDGNSVIIKIYTKNYTGKSVKMNSRETYKAFEFPLHFSKSKKFYTPKYISYTSDFYNNFGVVDWLPNCKIDANGYLSFKLSNLSNDVTLFIEGVAGDGRFLSTTKILDLANFN